MTLAVLCCGAASIDPRVKASLISPKATESSKTVGSRMAVAATPDMVTFSARWDAVTGAASYILGIGVTSGSYSTNIIATSTSASKTMIWPDGVARFFFAVRSVDSSGLAGPWSREVAFPSWPPDRAWMAWKSGSLERSGDLRIWVATNSTSPSLIMFDRPRMFWRAGALTISPFNPKNP